MLALILNVYVPESKTGVEGTDKEVLINALERFVCRGELCSPAETDQCPRANTVRPYGSNGRQITKIDFYTDGLSGGKNSVKMREYLCERLNIPYMPANSLIECVNILTDYGEYKKIVQDAQIKYKIIVK